MTCLFTAMSLGFLGVVGVELLGSLRVAYKPRIQLEYNMEPGRSGKGIM